MNAERILLVIILLALLIPPATSVTHNVSAGMTVTGKGPSGILVPIPVLDDILPAAQARIIHNWISVLILAAVAAAASQRTTRFFGIFVPVLAAMFMYFGWFAVLDSAGSTKLIGVIIVGLVIAVMLYMKGSLHEQFGIAGPGSPMFNIAFYIILLQVMVGFVNSTALWDQNAAPTVSNQYSNIDLQREVTSINDNAGANDPLSNTGSMFTDLAWGCVKMFLSIGASLVAFSVVLGVIYPWIWQSAYGPGLLLAIQVGIYIVYYMAFMRFAYKPSGEGEF